MAALLSKTVQNTPPRPRWGDPALDCGTAGRTWLSSAGEAGSSGQAGKVERANNSRTLKSLLLAFAPGGADAWPDAEQAQAQALAVLQSLNVELLTHDSATATLERWCARNGLESGIAARRLQGADVPPSGDTRALLQVGADEPVRHRKVQLVCGGRVLSEADNWYAPARLTPEMNRLLQETETPFGRVVAPLDFRRRTLSAELLSPAPADGALMGDASDSPPHLLEHRAVLSTPEGVPFSLVVERYTAEVLAFAPPL